jgi:glucosamine--fructose-6-phosphate aminotransferase (isomerizing)
MFHERSIMSLYSEIFEQPNIMRNLLSSQKEKVAEIASVIRKQNPSFVFLAARGTSDNAGRYANYLWGAYNGLPVALATPSLFTYYQAPPRLKNSFVIGISQSGQSPDIVCVLAEAKKQGCPTLAITNDINSPLARESDFVIDIQAGVEKAVAATKTYTAELMALAMLSVAIENDTLRQAELLMVPEWAERILTQTDHIKSIAQRYLFMERCAVLGRGFNYSTTFEWSLKLKELTYVVAEPYSNADFQHGPIAMVERGFPVMAVAPGGKVFGSLMEMLTNLRNDHGAELLVISDQQEALDIAQSSIQLPSDIPEWVSPLITIIPAQLFSYHLTQAKGYSTEAPRTIRKVTETN